MLSQLQGIPFDILLVSTFSGPCSSWLNCRVCVSVLYCMSCVLCGVMCTAWLFSSQLGVSQHPSSKDISAGLPSVSVAAPGRSRLTFLAAWCLLSGDWVVYSGLRSLRLRVLAGFSSSSDHINTNYQLPNGPVKAGRRWGQRHPQGANLGSNGILKFLSKLKQWLPPAPPKSLASQCMSGQPISTCHVLTS